MQEKSVKIKKHIVLELMELEFNIGKDLYFPLNLIKAILIHSKLEVCIN